MPRLKPLWEKYHDAGLSIVAIDNASVSVGAPKMIKEKNLPFHFVETKKGKDDPCVNIYKVEVVPYNMILDEQGRVFYIHKGYVEGDEKKMEEVVKKILKIS